jgi:hypothetical protein
MTQQREAILQQQVQLQQQQQQRLAAEQARKRLEDQRAVQAAAQEQAAAVRSQEVGAFWCSLSAAACVPRTRFVVGVFVLALRACKRVAQSWLVRL